MIFRPGPKLSKAEAHSAAPAHAGLAPACGVRHAAIIMDGNGRWAARRNLPRFVGHKQGVEAVRTTVRARATWGSRR